ncbi:CstA-like transporter-associated (seleno)protein [Pelistega ratti]|uniref:CstA-like transporter-associated (seleno)protein n=1 Tax=Pelistega ratti TaxID=2652177 RepID=UPI00135B650B|nr:CstA-like transporter-associated (seleno)protein [Pelistega ratti]
MKDKLFLFMKTAKVTMNLMAGIPDYDNYVAQQRKYNPDAPVMNKKEFLEYISKRRCSCAGRGGCC